MGKSSKRPLILTLGLLLLSAVLVSCHNKSEEDLPVRMPDTIRLSGAGATFPYPIYSKWFDEYQRLRPGVAINYQSIGSGEGIKRFSEGTVDFGASDDPMSDEQLAAFQKETNAVALHFPTVLGADVPSYNIPGISDALNFTPQALAGIYLGRIKEWNDPEIAKPNPKVKLPAADIVVTHRDDGSGTTYVWTDYLSKVSEEWKGKVGKGTSVNWPVGLGGKGNEGVSGLLKQTPNSIGYLELIYAVQNHLYYGRVQNSSGSFIKAELSSVTAAAAEASKSMPDDFRVLDYECNRTKRLSHFEFHLALDTEQDRRYSEEGSHDGVPPLDAYRRARLRRAFGLFAASTRSYREGNASHLPD